MRAIFKRGSWLVTIPVAALSALYLFAVFLPTKRSTLALKNDVKIKQQFVAQAASLVMAAHETEKEIAETREFIARRVALASEQRNGAVFGAVARIAKEAQVTTTHFDPQPDVDYGKFTRGRLEIGVRGTYAAIHAFLAGLEAMPASIWVEQIEIQRQSEDGEDLACEVRLDVFAWKSEKTGQLDPAGRR